MKPFLPKAEEELVRSFFIPERRERYLSGLSNPRKRRKLTDEFCHFKHLDSRYVHRIGPSHRHALDIYELLRQLGATERCWVLSDESFLDARTMNLDEALKQIVGNTFATFLCCVDGKLAYFENEEGRCILRRP